jgi:uncharacterized RDD family membrane protein YckC
MMQESIHAGFWKRFFAFIIDGIIVGVPTFIFSLLLKDIFLRLGENLWYIGFIILGLYFVPFNSDIGKGQTLGKKILKIRVVHGKGEFLTIPQSFFRYCILSLVIFSSGMGMSIYSLTGDFQIIATIYSILAIFVFFGVVILLIFNKDKRGLHDYLVNTMVINSKNIGDINVQKIDTLRDAFIKRKRAFIITIALFILVLSAVIILPKLLFNTFVSGADFNAMHNLRIDLEESFSISNVGVQTQWKKRWESGSKIETNKNLIVSVYLKYPIFKDKNAKSRLYEQIKDRVLSSYQNIENYDKVIIIFRTGYSLGITYFWMKESHEFPVESE